MIGMNKREGETQKQSKRARRIEERKSSTASDNGEKRELIPRS
jgi:hypothetical protein